MSTASIIAFLAFLFAFNVPAPVIQNVSTILYASQASTTAIQATTTLQATPTGEASVTVQNPNTQPSFGGIITPMDKSGIDVQVAQDGSRFRFNVRVLDTNGEALKEQTVHFDGPDVANQHPFKVDQITNALIVPGTNWQTWFVYDATTKGTQTITFTSGNLPPKTVSIEVQ